MNSKVIEAVRFKLADGITDDEFLKRVAPVNAWLNAQPGFVQRRLSCGPDGMWLDHLEWDSMADAQAASKALMENQDLVPFLQAVNPEGMEMRHEALMGSNG